MITSRPVEERDLETIQKACDASTFHSGLMPEHYVGDRKYAEIYEDGNGPIGVLSYTKTLRLCVAWCDENDRSRNAKAIIVALKNAVEKAKAAGFTEIIFETKNEKLANFCTKVMGFQASAGEYVLYVN